MGCRLIRFFFRIVLLAMIASGGLSPFVPPARAQSDADALNLLVVKDPISQSALFGYDPVAYQTNGAAVPGSKEFSYTWQGAVWYFVNEGNLAAFSRSPEVYAPRFGGYSAMGVARGVLTSGNPKIFSVYQNRLYLFDTVASRYVWSKDYSQLVRRAEENWGMLQKALHP